MDKNIHEIQSKIILIGILNDRRLIKGISIRIKVLFINRKIDKESGIMNVNMI